jgi:hypothetical protein
VFAQSPRLWSRLFVGGAVAAFQTGPKDVRYETIGISLARHHYFRVGYRGIMHALTAPFARSIIVREMPQQRSLTSITMKMSWA